MTDLNELADRVEALVVTCEACGQLLPTEYGKIDWPAFGRQLRLHMADLNLSLREAQSVSGIDQATIHRVAKHCKPVSADNYVALHAWMTQPARSKS